MTTTTIANTASRRGWAGRSVRLARVYLGVDAPH